MIPPWRPCQIHTIARHRSAPATVIEAAAPTAQQSRCHTGLTAQSRLINRGTARCLSKAKPQYCWNKHSKWLVNGWPALVAG